MASRRAAARGQADLWAARGRRRSTEGRLSPCPAAEGRDRQDAVGLRAERRCRPMRQPRRSQ